ncbi:hypothetical protein pb186bvf_001928 [Paramecium bursaria]
MGSCFVKTQNYSSSQSIRSFHHGQIRVQATFNLPVPKQSRETIPDPEDIPQNSIDIPRTAFNSAQNINTSNVQQVQFLTQNLIQINHNPTYNSRDITDDHQQLKCVGSGSFGLVYAIKNKKTKQLLAMKQVSKKTNICVEANILNDLNHPNIIRCLGVFQTKQYYQIVEELMEGQQLSSLLKAGPIDEGTARNYIQQILYAVTYLHDKNIIHRDLKPDNIMLTNKSNNDVIKIIDFGTAKFLNPSQKLNQKLGTLYYMAPEVFKSGFDYKVDVWSIGVILFQMLSGDNPFHANNETEVISKITSGNYNFVKDIWKTISKDGIDLVQQMLKIHPDKRVTAREALNHPWIKQHEHKYRNIHTIVKHIESFANLKLKEVVLLNMMLSVFNYAQDCHIYYYQFYQLDSDYKGSVKIKKLQEFLASQNQESQFLDKVLIYLNKTLDDELNFQDFEKLMIDRSKVINPQKIRRLYKYLDKDDDTLLYMEDVLTYYQDLKFWEELFKGKKCINKNDFYNFFL